MTNLPEFIAVTERGERRVYRLDESANCYRCPSLGSKWMSREDVSGYFASRHQGYYPHRIEAATEGEFRKVMRAAREHALCLIADANDAVQAFNAAKQAQRV